MLPDGKHKKQFYLSIDFIRDVPYTPKQRAYQESIKEAYPNVKELAVRGSENPNLMPEECCDRPFPLYWWLGSHYYG
jgi:pyruvate-ferredoxin/flavodoxin oxidoreductase